MQSQEEKSFIKFLDKYRPQIYRICYGFSNTQSDADDLYQESVMRIWKALEQHRGEAELSTWAYRITVNTCIYYQKKNKKELNFKDAIKNQVKNPSTTTNENLESQRKIKELRSAIQLLNKIDKSVILLVLEECSYNEIAEILGISLSNVGVKINRIKNRLRKTILNKEK